MRMIKILALALATAAPMALATTAEATCYVRCQPQGEQGGANGFFTGTVGSQNAVGGSGGPTVGIVKNWKEEEGSLQLQTGNNVPTVVVSKLKLATGGSGQIVVVGAGCCGLLLESGAEGVLGGEGEVGYEVD